MAQNKLQMFIRSGAAQVSINQTLKDESDDFTTSLISVINGNPMLQDCDPSEVVRTALKAASMHLPIDPALGLAYIIPFRNNKLKKMEPQLQIGWKGFVELALRSQQYVRINVTDVREGEYIGIDRMSGDMHFEWVQNDQERAKLKVIGYLGYFRLRNSFEKQHYMTVEQLQYHAKKYSQTYKKGYGKWVDDFVNMSRKTVIKLLISHWGPKSTVINKALRMDQAAMGEEDTYKYPDNDKDGIDPPAPDDADQRPEAEKKAAAKRKPKKAAIDGEVVDKNGK